MSAASHGRTHGNSKVEPSEENKRRISQVEPAEQWWVDHRDWLENRGYLLRPRFTPGWNPSWHHPEVNLEDAEDRFPADPNVLDAVKLPFGEPVMLKRVNKLQSTEVEITVMLSTPALVGDPRNHCIPVYDTLEVPDDDNLRILVLPLLRKYDDPPFDTVGEVVDCLRQVLEVGYGQMIRGYLELTSSWCQCVQFLHEHNIAHGDIEARHVMMHAAPLYDAPFHPVDQNMRFDWRGRIAPSRTRTEDPVEYHILDFSRASVHDPHASDAPASDKELGVADDVDDPFAHDVYSLGTWLRDDFLKETGRYKHLDVLEPLVDEMTRDDPLKRPTMKEVMNRFEEAISLLSSWKLRSRATEQVNGLQKYNHYGSHWARRLKLMAMSRPAVPSIQNENR